MTLIRGQWLFVLISVYLCWSVVTFFRGKKDLLDALHRPEPHHGRGSAALVEPRADPASIGSLLVGGL